ncbi:MAG: cysteine hydrolase [Deltaproteobacteria bacterium HGW-Deltaproteobacteria-19]|nr:MAG: cysteine hydrolase [Deltaproteobacteria bacterium HGW-Deltaproteobacteria-19]
MKRVLLLIDIQNDYFPGGKMELSGSAGAGEKAGVLLAAFRSRDLPVVHIQHVSIRPGSSFFLPDTEGVQVHASVQPREGEALFQKYYPNSFRETPLLEHLRRLEARQLFIAGMMTHMCVDSTVRAAFDLGFACSLAHDACATRSLSFGNIVVPAEYVHASHIAALHGIFCKAATVEELCAGL